jgi:hypothetical protein
MTVTEVGMGNRTRYDDGTVEISDSVYRCLMGALRTIAANDESCCLERTLRASKHSPSCAVGIARAAFREADRLNSQPNSVLDRTLSD